MAEENNLKCETAEIAMQRLLWLQKAMLSNPEFIKGLGAKHRYVIGGMARDIHTLSKSLYEDSLKYCKDKFN